MTDTPQYPAGNPANRADLIASLTEDLTPVNRLKSAHGTALIAFAAAVASIASIMIFGWWDGLLTGEASGSFIITNGLLLGLGAASSAALVSGALPRVGSRSDAPWWSAIMLGFVPLGAVITMLSGQGSSAYEGLNDPAAFYCSAASLIAGSLVLFAAAVWLRRGAPVSIERSAWLAGLAAGSIGAVAYGITCPHDTLSHVGLWHVAPVAIGAVIGRIVIPPLIRW